MGEAIGGLSRGGGCEGLTVHEGGGVFPESYMREARFLARWDQHAVAQRGGGGGDYLEP